MRRTQLKRKSYWSKRSKPKKTKLTGRPKLRLVSLKTLKKEAWTVFARYIRRRDGCCVTCLVEGAAAPAENAGHYRHNSERNQSLGGNALWYDPRNIHGQCIRCNKWKSGNAEPYAIFLQRKYGHGILEEIRTLYKTYKKWTREEIQEIINKYSDYAD